MSEIRQDLVSGSWVIIAPERAKRPTTFLEKKKKRVPSPKKICPFENLEKNTSGAWPPILSSPDMKRWKAVIIPNKYPALPHREICAEAVAEGPYTTLTAVGSHDLLITRDHTKNFADLDPVEGLRVFELFAARYRMLAKDPCLKYTSVFFNWGSSAGASVFHPHYQILTLPMLPPHIQNSLEASRAYFTRTKHCAHCATIAFEHTFKKRIIAENEGAIAISSFAAREPFEIRIYPKRHVAFFEDTPRATLLSVAHVLRASMKMIRNRLHDPDLNFFIHTAPLKDRKQYHHYHWHIELYPRTSIGAGFEEGTEVRINTVDPDFVAKLLRGK